MEIDRVIKTDHHTNLLLGFFGFTTGGIIQSTFQSAAQVGGFFLLQFLQCLGNVLVVQVGGVLERLQELLQLSRRGESGDIVDTSDRSNEIAVRDIGECGQMCLVAAFFGDVAASANNSPNLLVFGV